MNKRERAKKFIPTSVSFPKEVHKRIKERAERDRRSVSAYILCLAEKDLAVNGR